MSGYIGRDGEPISEQEAMQALGDKDARHVRVDEVNGHGVSTVWLVIDHGFGGEPLIFETMIFSHHGDACELDEWQDRYPTEVAAVAGHDQACALARDARCGAEGS